MATNLICTGLAARVTPVNVGRSHDLSARNRRVAYKRNVILRDQLSQLQGSSCAAPADDTVVKYESSEQASRDDGRACRAGQRRAWDHGTPASPLFCGGC